MYSAAAADVQRTAGRVADEKKKRKKRAFAKEIVGITQHYATLRRIENRLRGGRSETYLLHLA